MKSLIFGLFIILGALFAPNAFAAAKIYKTVDKDGNVIFSDVPPANGADSMKLEDINQYSTPAATQPDLRAQVEALAEDAAKERAESYQAIAISAPGHDAAIRENTGNVTVSVNVTPALRNGDSVQIVMDGAVVRSTPATTVALENVDRGSHELLAQVIDDNGNVVISSKPITFHMLRYSQLHRRN